MQHSPDKTEEKSGKRRSKWPDSQLKYLSASSKYRSEVHDVTTGPRGEGGYHSPDLKQHILTQPTHTQIAYKKEFVLFVIVLKEQPYELVIIFKKMLLRLSQNIMNKYVTEISKECEEFLLLSFRE